MKKIIIFLAILIVTILLTSCTTQQRVVYRDCDCNTTTFGFGLGWNTNPYWGWNDPLWGWNSWNWYPYRVIPRYYIPNRVQPHQPSRYERRTNVGPRPSRNTQNWSNDVDPMYPRRTPSIPSINVEPSQRTTQPSRIQSTPSRIESTPNRYSQPQQRSTQPSRVQSNPSRYNQNSQPSRVQSTPSRTQTPINRSRVGNEPVSNLKPKWYAPQQSTNGNTTPMVTPQIIFQGENGRGYSGPGGFGRGY